MSFSVPASALTLRGYDIAPGADLHGANLNYLNLSNVNLSGANLAGANLYGANLRGTNLAGANLTGTNLAGANLISADMAGANLTNAHLEVSDLTSANLDSAVFAGWTAFVGANLSRAKLTNTSMAGVHLDGANVNSSNFSNTSFVGLPYSPGLVGTPLNLPPEWQLRNGALLGPGVSFQGQLVQGKDFSHLNLTGSDFSFSIVTGSNFTGANLRDAKLNRARWRDLNLDEVRSGGIAIPDHVDELPAHWHIQAGFLTGPRADFSGNNLDGLDFSGEFDGANFTSCSMRGTKLRGSSLRGADFSHASLAGANLEGASLEKATFNGADLDQANLGLAYVDGTEFANANLANLTDNRVIGAPASVPSGWGYFDSNGGYNLLLKASKFEPLGAPTVTGDHTLGGVLSADAAFWTTLNAHPSFQWLRNGQIIQGATYQGFGPMQEDIGQMVSVRITLSQIGFETQAFESTRTLIGGGVLGLTPNPAIVGDAAVGNRLRAVTGNWDATSLKFQWLRDGDPIVGATSEAYDLTPSDFGTLVGVQVTGSKLGYFDVSTRSADLRVGLGALVLSPVPKIEGQAQVGHRISAVPGDWGAAVLRYQWLRNGIEITGETADTYLVTAADADASIAVKVTGSKAGYRTVSQESASSKIALGQIAAPPAPMVVGIARVGQILNAQPGSWGEKTKLTFTWLSNGVAVASGDPRYKLAPKDVGHRITVRVAGSSVGYETLTLDSETIIVQPGQMVSFVPRILGIAKAGRTLKAATAPWVKGAHVEYQWTANGLPLKGSTKVDIKLTAALKGKKLQVIVKQSLLGYLSASRNSSKVSVG